jgi:hypothetical protein
VVDVWNLGQLIDLLERAPYDLNLLLVVDQVDIAANYLGGNGRAEVVVLRSCP